MWASGKRGTGTLQVVTGTGGDIVTDWVTPHRVGRWEIRFRSRTTRTGPLEPGQADYRIQAELVPAGPVTRCPASSITMAAYTPGKTRASSHRATVGVTKNGVARGYEGRVHAPVSDVGPWVQPANDPDTSSWHAWAVEVTRSHISWFLDGKIIRTTKKPAVLFGHTRLHFRLSILATPGARMVPAVTQLDWARYWTLAHTTTKPKLVKQLHSAPPMPVATEPVDPGCDS